MSKKQMLSEFLDNEIDSRQADAVMDTVRADSQARDALTVFQLIKDAMGGVEAFDDGYSQRIFARIWPHTPARDAHDVHDAETGPAQRQP